MRMETYGRQVELIEESRLRAAATRARINELRFAITTTKRAIAASKDLLRLRSFRRLRRCDSAARMSSVGCVRTRLPPLFMLASGTSTRNAKPVIVQFTGHIRTAAVTQVEVHVTAP